MRRTSGPQAGSTFFIRKQTAIKNKSPNVTKAKSRGKKVHESSGSHTLMARKNNSFAKTEQNQSSTFFTQHNKTKKSFPDPKKAKDLKKYEKQIMQVLHTSASIIQREWRKYLIRKYKKQLALKMLEKEKVVHLPQPLPQFDAVSGRTSQYSEAYNHKKYYSCENSGVKGQKGDRGEKANQNSFGKGVFSFNLSQSKAEKIDLSPEKIVNVKIQESNPANNSIQLKHNRTRSDQTALNPIIIKIPEKQPQKHLEITPKIINVVIEAEQPKPKPQPKVHPPSHAQPKQAEQIKYQDHYIKSQKGSIDEILRKLQTKLEEKKLKKILALENSFSNNLMTFRSYKKNCDSVAEEHDKKLTLLENKKKRLIAKLNQFVSLCEENLDQLQSEDHDTESKKIPQNENHHLDMSFNEQMSGFNSRSLMLEDWDIDGQFSEKKIQARHQIQRPGHGQGLGPGEGRKSQEILIDDSGRDITIIDQLGSQNGKEEGEEGKGSGAKVIEPKEIFSTPPKQLDHTAYKLESLPPQPKTQAQQPQPQQKTASQPSKTHPKPVPQPQPPKPLYTEPQILQQLQKFHPIKPTIDIVNNWLLEVSHFILDNFGPEFSRKLVYIEQPPAYELLRHCITGQPFPREYTAISLKIFKQFQFFHFKTLLAQEKVEGEKKEPYSALMYTFHQALYDCLNRMLLDELIEGRNWIHYPWSSQFKVKKLIGPDHSKQALEKAINRVSNISDYNIMATQDPPDPGREFEHTQHNLIFAQEIKEIPLSSQIQRGHLVYRISRLVQKQLFQEEYLRICNIFK